MRRENVFVVSVGDSENLPDETKIRAVYINRFGSITKLASGCHGLIPAKIARFLTKTSKIETLLWALSGGESASSRSAVLAEITGTVIQFELLLPQFRVHDFDLNSPVGAVASLV